MGTVQLESVPQMILHPYCCIAVLHVVPNVALHRYSNLVW